MGYTAEFYSENYFARGIHGKITIQVVFYSLFAGGVEKVAFFLFFLFSSFPIQKINGSDSVKFLTLTVGSVNPPLQI